MNRSETPTRRLCPLLGAWGLLLLLACPSARGAEAPAWLERGRAALAGGDVAGADDSFSGGLAQDPSQAPGVGAAWRDAALRALEEANPERASALFSKAVAQDPGLAPEAGARLLEAARAIPEETARARVVVRAVPWAGAEAVAAATVAYLEARLGAAWPVDLTLPGWVELTKARPGDEFVYVAAAPFLQRDGGTLRRMPPSVEGSTRYVFIPQDMGGAPETRVRLSRDQTPTKVYLWLIPASAFQTP